MSTISIKTFEALATTVWFSATMMFVRLLDGREIGVPLEWLPVLKGASEQQRSNWRLVGRGVGIHWEELDEDISVPALIK
jgi:hypothetical protein